MGTGWGPTETILANSITIGGNTTQHRKIVTDSNGHFGPITIKITQAFTTEGDKDIVITGSVSLAQTFDDYWTVTAGCGINDMDNCGDLSYKNADKEELIDAIKQGLRVYNGYLRQIVATSSLPHTLGNYPEITRKMVAFIATSYLWFSDGATEEYRTRSETAWKMAFKLMDLVKHRQVQLELPDGTFIAFNPSMKLTENAHTGSWGVYAFWDEELFD